MYNIVIDFVIFYLNLPTIPRLILFFLSFSALHKLPFRLLNNLLMTA
jgi:hypothetical protein